MRDDLIKQSLSEKQQIFAALCETVLEQQVPHKGLLLRGDASDLQHGETLLKGAIDEGESEEDGIHLKLSTTFVFFFSFMFVRQSFVCHGLKFSNSYNSRLMLFFVLFVFWSAVENLQSLLFTRIGDQNPNDEKKTCGEQVGTADDVGEAEQNHAASAKTCKIHIMAIGGAKELNFW